MNLRARVGSLELPTPVIGASGLFGYGDEYGGLVDYGSMGAVVTKTITLEPREGNEPPRMVDVGSGVINSIGLENMGLEAFVETKLPELDVPCLLIVSIAGATPEEYREIAARLDGQDRVAAIEVNVSCPNVGGEGAVLGSDPDCIRSILEGIRRETELPLLAKVPPLVWGLEDVCRAAVAGGADGLTVANTYPAMAIDCRRARPVLGAVSGGLSGGAIKPISLLLVWKAARAVRVPIVAAGGIERAEDAIEYILAGAAAFEIGSVILKSHKAPSQIAEGLIDYMNSKGHSSLEDFRGRAA